MPHPLEKFAFCPACGSPCFEENDARSKRCRQCGFTFYLNASASTVAVVLNAKGELLVVRRAHEPARGTLDLPGGFVDPGESITDGMLRELRDEVGAEGVIERFLFSLPNLYTFSGFDVPTVDSFFLCRLHDEASVCAGDDAAEAFWVPLSALEPSAFGLHSIRRGVEMLLDDLKD